MGDELSDVLGADHDRIDALFQRLLAAAWNGRNDAAFLARDLEQDLLAHIRFEEEALFPALAAVPRYPARCTESLVIDHEMIRDTLALLRARLEVRDFPGARTQATTLAILLEGHNRDEEIGVYRDADRLLGRDRRTSLVAAFRSHDAEVVR